MARSRATSLTLWPRPSTSSTARRRNSSEYLRGLPMPAVSSLRTRRHRNWHCIKPGVAQSSNPHGDWEQGQGIRPAEVAPVLHLLRRPWALGEERIILGTALIAHLRKRRNAQRLGLSTCKTGALPLSYGPKRYC